MRIPRDVYGRDFANHLIRRWEFREVHQTGSHIILRTETPFGCTISVPDHKPLSPGTFRQLLKDIAEHKKIVQSELLIRL